MSFNDLTLLLMAIATAGVVFVAWRFDKERLYASIIMFLVLIALTGSKLVTFLGFETNAGNIFYAGAFLATYFIVERHGKREGVKTIGTTVVAMVFFLTLLTLALSLKSVTGAAPGDDQLAQALAPTLRIAFASTVSYVMSQSANLLIYLSLKKRYGHRYLWLRANIANAVAQVLDSFVFFTIAFAGVVAPANILEIMVVGFAIKVLFMACAAPLLYLNHVEEDTDGKFNTLVIR